MANLRRPNHPLFAALLVAACWLAGCGESDLSGADAGPRPDAFAVGAICDDDEQCATGVCWDFHDYDIYCFGAVCSATCTLDDECEAIFTAAGAPLPQASSCGTDNRCTAAGTGLGEWVCT